MDLSGANGWNHIVAGIAAAVAVPVGVFGFALPLWAVLPIALAIYGGVAVLLAPARAIDRVNPDRVGRAQAELVAGLIEDGEREVARLDAAARQLKSQTAAPQVAHMADVAQSILDCLAEEPGKLPVMRRFLTYYLPRAAEMAEGLVVVEGQRSPNPARRAQIEDILGKLDHAFTFYSDSFAQAELDVLDVELKLIGRSLAEDIGAEPVAAPREKGPS